MHCPNWCSRVHDDRLWPECCDGVVHSATLEIHPFDAGHRRVVVVTLASFESVNAGLERATICIEAIGDTGDLTPDQVDEYAATLKRTAAKARDILANG